MSRLFLVAAMLVSLWPAGVLAATFAADSSTTDTGGTSVEQPADTPSEPDAGASQSTPSDEPTPPQADIGEFNQLAIRVDRLVKRMNNDAQLRHAIPSPRLAVSASALARDLRRWRRENVGLDGEAERIALRRQQVSQRIAALAAAPSQSRLNAVNTAIEAYNQSIK